MEILLTQADLDAMPSGLREQLFSYLGKTWPAGEHQVAEAVSLTREQAIALLREVSFHHAGAHLRVLLERLAYADAGRPPTRDRLTEILKTQGEHLGLYLGFLNRITAKVTGRPGARLCDHQKDADIYTVPAATRALLRELLETLKSSGRGEEPLWEFWE
jgi:hypothetical protein